MLLTTLSPIEHNPRDPLSNFNGGNKFGTHSNNLFDKLENVTKNDVIYIQSKRSGVHSVNYRFSDVLDSIVFAIDTDAALVTSSSKTCAEMTKYYPQVKSIMNSIKISIGHNINIVKAMGRFCGVSRVPSTNTIVERAIRDRDWHVWSKNRRGGIRRPVTRLHIQGHPSHGIYHDGLRQPHFQHVDDVGIKSHCKTSMKSIRNENVVQVWESRSKLYNKSEKCNGYDGYYIRWRV